jgi:aspartate aminotransferase
MDLLADRLNLIRPSSTGAITQRAEELRDQGVDVLSLSVGEPDFDTPSHIFEAAVRALHSGMTRYTSAQGMPSLRRAVAMRSEQVRGVPCREDQVVVTVGAKHALFEFFQAVLNPEDEVIIPAPYWVSYPEQVRLAEGVPVIAQTSMRDGFTLTAQEFNRLKTPKTKVLVINTPNNPTGSVYPKRTLHELVEAAAGAGIWVLCDEVYRDLVYGHKKHVSPLSLARDEQRERVFVVDGVSKSFAMTGWRIGWGIGHPEVIQGMTKIQSQSTTNTATVAQAASLAALTGDTDFLSKWRKHYVKRRDAICGGLSRIEGVECPVPDGAFYVLPCVKTIVERMGDEATDVTLASTLLEEARVAVVPGSAFGAPGHLRLSYATSLEVIEEAVSRMKAVMDNL